MRRTLFSALVIVAIVACTAPRPFQDAIEKNQQELAATDPTDIARVEELKAKIADLEARAKENVAIDWGEMGLVIAEIAAYVLAGGAGVVGLRQVRRRLGYRKDDNLVVAQKELE